MSELTPYLAVRDARAAIDWYVENLGATVTFEPMVMDDGRVGHVELDVDGAGWMMGLHREEPLAPDVFLDVATRAQFMPSISASSWTAAYPSSWVCRMRVSWVRLVLYIAWRGCKYCKYPICCNGPCSTTQPPNCRR